MTTAVFLAVLFLASLWFELSGTGPRFRTRIEMATYRWVTGGEEKPR